MGFLFRSWWCIRRISFSYKWTQIISWAIMIPKFVHGLNPLLLSGMRRLKLNHLYQSPNLSYFWCSWIAHCMRIVFNFHNPDCGEEAVTSFGFGRSSTFRTTSHSLYEGLWEIPLNSLAHSPQCMIHGFIHYQHNDWLGTYFIK